MRPVVVALLISFLATLAAADPTAARALPDGIGVWVVGAKGGSTAAVPKPVPTTFAGCNGGLVANAKRGRVASLVFVGGADCDPAAVRAEIVKQADAPGLTIGRATMWTTADRAVVLETDGTGADRWVHVHFLPRDDKQVCFLQDGFVDFFSSWRQAVATNDPKKMEPFFRFPFKDGSGLLWKTKKDFEGAYATLFTKDRRHDLIDDQGLAECDADRGLYHFYFPDVAVDIIATKVGKGWKFTEAVKLPAPHPSED